MHYNVKAVPEALLGKACFKKCFGWATLSYMKLKTDLNKKAKSKTYLYDLLPINNLYSGYIKSFEKETGEFSDHVFCGKSDNITQKQMDIMLYIM